MPKKVSFDAVEIRSYPIVLSDNPECHYGPSIELGWEYHAASPDERLPLSDYEASRSKRRTVRQLYLSQVQREKMLEPIVTPEELQQALREKDRARRYRQVSNSLQDPVSKVSDSVRASRRHKQIRRAVRNLQKKQQRAAAAAADELTDIYSGWWLPWSAFIF
jgi:hypothetical protein